MPKLPLSLEDDYFYDSLQIWCNRGIVVGNRSTHRILHQIGNQNDSLDANTLQNWKKIFCDMPKTIYWKKNQMDLVAFLSIIMMTVNYNTSLLLGI